MPTAPFARTTAGMVDVVDPNVFETANAGFAQAMYEEFLKDPATVGPDWRRLFESGVVGERPPAVTNGSRAAEKAEGTSIPADPAAAATRLPAGASPIRGPQARLVANMTESLTVPTATTFRVLPVGVLEERRRRLNKGLEAGGRTGKISFTHLIAYSLVQATKQHRVMGHTLVMSDGVPHRVVPEGISLGLAVDVQRKDGSRGLVVPVIKRADTMDFATFHAAYEALVEKARNNRLMPDDFAGATMSLTNPGGLGHRGLGAPAHGRPGQHHRGRRHRLPGGIFRRGRGPAQGVRDQQGHDDHEHLRPPGHSGRGIGSLSRRGGSPPAG